MTNQPQNPEWREALERVRHTLVCLHNLRATDLTDAQIDDRLAAGVDQAKLEWMIDNSEDIALLDAILALSTNPTSGGELQPNPDLAVSNGGLAITASRSPQGDEAAPIPMILHCPKCGLQHIDTPHPAHTEHMLIGGDPAEVTLEEEWLNPPHRSHLCHSCGRIWRPADVPTKGVAAIKTKGQNDSPHPNAELTDEGWVMEPIPAPFEGLSEEEQDELSAGLSALRKGEPLHLSAYDAALLLRHLSQARRVPELKAEVARLRESVGSALSQLGSGWPATAETTLRAALSETER